MSWDSTSVRSRWPWPPRNAGAEPRSRHRMQEDSEHWSPCQRYRSGSESKPADSAPAPSVRAKATFDLRLLALERAGESLRVTASRARRLGNPRIDRTRSLRGRSRDKDSGRWARRHRGWRLSRCGLTLDHHEMTFRCRSIPRAHVERDATGDQNRTPDRDQQGPRLARRRIGGAVRVCSSRLACFSAAVRRAT